MKWPEQLSITGGIAFFKPLALSGMNWKIFKSRTCLNLISAIIMVLGLSSAALIYQRADDLPYGAVGYGMEDGTIYSIMPQDSKIYRHNLEVYGGKLNVMLDDFNRWFVGLWHGKSLAVIIACTTIIISFGFFYAANYLLWPLNSDAHDEHNPD